MKINAYCQFTDLWNLTSEKKTYSCFKTSEQRIEHNRRVDPGLLWDFWDWYLLPPISWITKSKRLPVGRENHSHQVLSKRGHWCTLHTTYPSQGKNTRTGRMFSHVANAWGWTNKVGLCVGFGRIVKFNLCGPVVSKLKWGWKLPGELVKI